MLEMTWMFPLQLGAPGRVACVRGHLCPLWTYMGMNLGGGVVHSISLMLGTQLWLPTRSCPQAAYMPARHALVRTVLRIWKAGPCGSHGLCTRGPL